MGAEIALFNDILNNRLVIGLNDKTTFSIPVQFQGAKLDIKLWPVMPSGNASPPFFSKVVIANLLPFIYVGPRAGVTALLAAQETWTSVLDADGSGTGHFRATLDLNTTEMNTAVGTADSISTFVEIHMSESGVRRPTYQSAITIQSVVRDPTGAVSLPTPAASYPTWVEAFQTFVMWANSTNANNRGKSLELVSPDGIRLRFLGMRNDGTAQDDLL